MKKIPTLFEREYDEKGYIKQLFPIVKEGLEWVLAGEGIATIKVDGACCAIIGGEFYKRYDAKHGKQVPEGAIRCQEAPDSVTGYMPCWVKCDRNNPGDKWFWVGYDALPDKADGTYEAIGPHFQANPYQMEIDMLVRHGCEVVDVERSYEGLKEYLTEHVVEGIVFWKDGEPKCKIKRRDFGLKWGNNTRKR